MAPAPRRKHEDRDADGEAELHQRGALRARSDIAPVEKIRYFIIPLGNLSIKKILLSKTSSVS